jgi:thiosulfate/3-mercaptopyruvate sulfurtransferase
MTLRTLVSTEDLAGMLHDPQLVIVDCRFDLKDTSAQERAFAESHIPGARYAHVDRDLSGPTTGTNGRHPLPDPLVFARTLGRLGISNASQVVVYDQDSGGFAARLWWMLRWLGHDAVALLDGGFAKWQREGRPVTSAVPAVAPQTFVPHLRPEMLVTAEQVAARSAGQKLVDARAPERYRGDVEPIDKAAGHIPGALNHPFLSNLDDSGAFKSAGELRAAFRREIGDTPGEQLVVYCGSGVTACQNLVALEHAGINGAKLYAGSWSEWSADPKHPIAKGDESPG